MHLVDEILVKLETADNTTKNMLENELVEQGSWQTNYNLLKVLKEVLLR